MPISYDERRKRREALRKTLLPALQPYIALRNVEASTRLSTDMQAMLFELAQQDGISIPAAIAYFGEHPDTTLEEARAASAKQPSNAPSNSPSFPEAPLEEVVADPQTIQQITQLILACFNDMPQISAEALAASETMSELVAVHMAHQQLFQSPHASTDFLIIAFYKLIQQTLSQLDQAIADNPALPRAFAHSAVSINLLP